MLGWLFRGRKADAEANVSGADAESRLHSALQHHREGRLAEARAGYAAVLAIEPENVDALHFLGVLAYQESRHAEAEALIRKALARNDANAPAHNNLGLVIAAAGRPAEALASFRRATALQSGYFDAYANLAAAAAKERQWLEAEAAFRSALALQPRAAGLQVGLGNVLVQLGKRDEAEA